ncbi:hypothetical protein BN1708_009905 [Verticillium longisporum]|uniref:Uncharacterized protein n=1 Tax=Verticillium longisporum TaxID=100787 RepID=A0A0G4KLZ5_VERLO|nr:hypothetical protein BN1708_009905 [Verticillium longisporum]
MCFAVVTMGIMRDCGHRQLVADASSCEEADESGEWCPSYQWEWSRDPDGLLYPSGICNRCQASGGVIFDGRNETIPAHANTREGSVTIEDSSSDSNEEETSWIRERWRRLPDAFRASEWNEEREGPESVRGRGFASGQYLGQGANQSCTRGVMMNKRLEADNCLLVRSSTIDAEPLTWKFQWQRRVVAAPREERTTQWLAKASFGITGLAVVKGRSLDSDPLREESQRRYQAKIVIDLMIVRLRCLGDAGPSQMGQQLRRGDQDPGVTSLMVCECRLPSAKVGAKICACCIEKAPFVTRE